MGIYRLFLQERLVEEKGGVDGLDKTGEGVEYGNELIRMLRLDPELCNFTTLNIFYEQYTVLEGGGTVLGGGGRGYRLRRRG